MLIKLVILSVRIILLLRIYPFVTVIIMFVHLTNAHVIKKERERENKRKY